MSTKKINLIVGIGGELDIKYLMYLLNLGVREFFVGYVPKYWSDNFGFDLSPNRRYSSHFQICNKKDFLLLCKILKKYDSKVFFTLNDHNYSIKTLPYIKKIIEETNTYVDGYIIADLSLLSILGKYNTEIHISGDNYILNTYSLNTLWSLGANRIIFPRNMSWEELVYLIEYRNKNLPDLQIEVFLGDSLLYSCGLCTSYHGEENNIFCRNSDANTREIFNYNGEKIKQIVINPEEQVFVKNCSLCFLNTLINLGVNSFKIPGRTKEYSEILKKVIYFNDFTKDEYKEGEKRVKLIERNDCKLKNCIYEY